MSEDKVGEGARAFVTDLLHHRDDLTSDQLLDWLVSFTETTPSVTDLAFVGAAMGRIIGQGFNVHKLYDVAKDRRGEPRVGTCLTYLREMCEAGSFDTTTREHDGFDKPLRSLCKAHGLEDVLRPPPAPPKTDEEAKATARAIVREARERLGL